VFVLVLRREVEMKGKGREGGKESLKYLERRNLLRGI